MSRGQLTMIESAIGRVWTLWLPVLVALLPATFFVLIGSQVRQPDGIPYACPSAAAELLGDPAIRPVVREGEVRLYDPADPALVNPPGVAERCRQHTVEGVSIAFLVLATGLVVGLVRSGALPVPGRGRRPAPAARGPEAAGTVAAEGKELR